MCVLCVQAGDQSDAQSSNPRPSSPDMSCPSSASEGAQAGADGSELLDTQTSAAQVQAQAHGPAVLEQVRSHLLGSVTHAFK